VNSLNIKI